MSNPIEEAIHELRDRFEGMQSDPSMSFERESEWALQMIYKDVSNDPSKVTASVVANGNIQAVREAFLNVAAIGISLNPARKLAYLLVRDSKIVYDLSYLGLVELAVTSGVIRWAQPEVVHANDTFRRVGIDRAPVHEFEPFATDRGTVVGVYVTAKLPDGDFLTTTMPVAKVDEIMKKSRGYSTAYSPWKTAYDEMAKKTVIKRAAKFWKTSDGRGARLDQAIQHLNDGSEGIDFSQAEAPPPPVIQRPRAIEAPADTPTTAAPPAASPPVTTGTPPAERPTATAAAGDSPAASEGERNFIRGKLKGLNITPAAAMEANGFPADGFETMTKAQWATLKTWQSTQQKAA